MKYLLPIVMQICLQTGAMGQEFMRLESILTDDGSVDLSAPVQGSFDTRGYEMRYGDQGEPRFIPHNDPQNAPGDETNPGLPGYPF